MKKCLLYISGTIVSVVIFVWLSISMPHSLRHLATIMTQNHYYFLGFRWMIIVLFYLLWPLFIQMQSDRLGWSVGQTHYWLIQRIKLTMFLIIFEFLVCENLPILLIHHL